MPIGCNIPIWRNVFLWRNAPLWRDFTKPNQGPHPGNALIKNFKFLYGKTYGWALRFRIKGQVLTSLYPTQGGFTAQVNLSPEAVEQAQGMGLGRNVQQAIERANPYPEGRWLFIPVESEEDVRDVQRLLTLRVETKRLQK